jgi:hypothetical protein
MFQDRVSLAPQQVFTTARANKARTFPKTTGDGSSASERLQGDVIAAIQHTPKFNLDRSAPVFTIGSCFARNIEMYLAHSKIDCLTTACTVPGEAYELEGYGARNGALNAYTPGSMLDLLRLTRQPDPLRCGTLDVGNDQWCDMLMSGLRFMSQSETLVIRRRLVDTYASLPRAATVIVTLGYPEAWYDNQDGIFVNRAPAGNTRLNRRADRYSFVNMTVADCCNCLEEIVREIRTQTEHRAKIVITVSPVPLTSTFTAEDVVIANDFSKAALLSAARQVTSKYDYCDYFPSFQFVNHAPRAEVFEEDGIHVKLDYVGRIVERFKAEYF